MGWFHKKCVKELKWKSIKKVINPKFKFTCKECLEYQKKFKNEKIISLIPERIVEINSIHVNYLDEEEEANNFLNNQIMKKEEMNLELSEQNCVRNE
jgi:hypothetical protein